MPAVFVCCKLSQTFQQRHPDVVVVAMNVLEAKSAPEAIDRLVTRQKLDALRIAHGKEWQRRFGLPEQIPMTLVITLGKVRVVHDTVMADPVSSLEADLKAIQTHP